MVGQVVIGIAEQIEGRLVRIESGAGKVQYIAELT
jgi:hypothetical protein